jgi:hypothetical protein
MAYTTMTSTATPTVPVMKTALQNQKAHVQMGLKRSLVAKDIWQPLEFKWYLRWKKHVNFDVDGADHRSDEVI